MSDEDEIRTLITRWAEAVHTGNLATVLAVTDRRWTARQGRSPVRLPRRRAGPARPRT